MTASKTLTFTLAAAISLLSVVEPAFARIGDTSSAPSAPSAASVEEGDSIQQARQQACEDQGGTHASGIRCLDRQGNVIDR